MHLVISCPSACRHAMLSVLTSWLLATCNDCRLRGTSFRTLYKWTSGQKAHSCSLQEHLLRSKKQSLCTSCHSHVVRPRQITKSCSVLGGIAVVLPAISKVALKIAHCTRCHCLSPRESESNVNTQSAS